MKTMLLQRHKGNDEKCDVAMRLRKAMKNEGSKNKMLAALCRNFLDYLIMIYCVEDFLTSLKLWKM
jgi:hypothetical protein